MRFRVEKEIFEKLPNACFGVVMAKNIANINPVVDLGNAVSLKYTLPMGAHDLSGNNNNNDDICIRLAKAGDTFLPFGTDVEETPDIGEVIYAVGKQVRTRRWTWRQSENGKISADPSDIFFPIDGFSDFNREQLIIARDELNSLIRQIFKCETTVGIVDVNNPEMEL